MKAGNADPLRAADDTVRHLGQKMGGCRGGWTTRDSTGLPASPVLGTCGDMHGISAAGGGVDAFRAAALVHRAVGRRFRPYLVDAVPPRKDEASVGEKRLTSPVAGRGCPRVDAGKRFYSELAGVTEPEAKREILGRLLLEGVEQEVKDGALPPRERPLWQDRFDPVAPAPALQERGPGPRPGARLASRLGEMATLRGPGRGIRILGEVKAQRASRTAPSTARRELRARALRLRGRSDSARPRGPADGFDPRHARSHVRPRRRQRRR